MRAKESERKGVDGHIRSLPDKVKESNLAFRRRQAI
jgi:hypothetical protein